MSFLLVSNGSLIVSRCHPRRVSETTSFHRPAEHLPLGCAAWGMGCLPTRAEHRCRRPAVRPSSHASLPSALLLPLAAAVLELPPAMQSDASLRAELVPPSVTACAARPRHPGAQPAASLPVGTSSLLSVVTPVGGLPRGRDARSPRAVAAPCPGPLLRLQRGSYPGSAISSRSSTCCLVSFFVTFCLISLI